MSMIPTAATVPAVRALLKTTGKRGMMLSDVAHHFGCSTNTAGKVLRKLVAADLVVVDGVGRTRYIDKAIWEEPEAPVVAPFKWDAWTRPLQGYNLFAHRDLAMAGRAA